MGTREPGGNIVLIGFMGSGKSEVGRRLADRTGHRFVDTDELVEAGGLSIPDIFAAEGEKGFRRRERVAVKRASKRKHAVVATGGGAILDPENVASLKRSGVVVYLSCGPKELARRLEGTEGRPLLDPTAPERGIAEDERDARTRRRRRIRRLLEERLPVYEAAADHVVPCDGLDPDGVVSEILHRLRLDDREPSRTRAVSVEVAEPYRVWVGRGLLRRAAELVQVPPSAERICVVTHPRIRRLWGEALVGGLEPTGLAVTTLTFPEGEERKTLDTVSKLYHRLATARFGREDVVVAFGGGVVGDVAGFTASTYGRGVVCIQIPTTLLAMVDAAIGGKTGFNLPEGKNLVGTFHQPATVIADIDVLATLSERELRGGLAEVAKYAFIAEPDLGELVVEQRDEVFARGDVLEEIVFRSASIKAEVVAEDEREADRRRILNYGHTLGHALEALSLAGGTVVGGRGAIHHGEAISIGMMYSAWVSVLSGLCGKDVVEHQERILTGLGLPTAARGVGWRDVEGYLRLDKKYAKGLRLVLLEGLGKPVVRGDLPDDVLVEALERVMS